MTIAADDLLPEGLEDRLPASAFAAARVTRAITDVMASHGYDRVQPPMIEFERSLAARMAGVQQQRLFRFVDPASLRMLALRSDMTVQVGRMAATRLAAAPRPLRLSYAGQVLTIRGDGLEPARERLQCGAELIGNDSVAAARELIRMAVDAVLAAGGTDICVDFTLPDLVDVLAAGPLPVDADQLDTVKRELDAKDAGGISQLGADAYLPLLAATGPFETALDRLYAINGGAALESRIEALRAIASALPGHVALTLDPTERHGFEYQSWFGFSIFARGVRGVVGRGGSYAIRHADGRQEPAVGFSLYPDGLIDLAAEEAAPRRLFLPIGHDEDVAARLRAIGWQTVAALGNGCDAAALGCTHVLDGAETRAV